MPNQITTVLWALKNKKTGTYMEVRDYINSHAKAGVISTWITRKAARSVAAFNKGYKVVKVNNTIVEAA